MSDCETYRLTLEPLIAAQAKANESAGGKGAGKGRSAKGSQIVANPIDTRDAIAKEAGSVRLDCACGVPAGPPGR